MDVVIIFDVLKPYVSFGYLNKDTNIIYSNNEHINGMKFSNNYKWLTEEVHIVFITNKKQKQFWEREVHIVFITNKKQKQFWERFIKKSYQTYVF